MTINHPGMDTNDLYLHDQGADAVTHRYSVQTKEGGVLFLWELYT